VWNRWTYLRLILVPVPRHDNGVMIFCCLKCEVYSLLLWYRVRSKVSILIYAFKELPVHFCYTPFNWKRISLHLQVSECLWKYYTNIFIQQLSAKSRISSSLCPPYQLWGLPSLLSNGYWGLFRRECETDHSPSTRSRKRGSIHPLPHTSLWR
jgi:hypothetical protein